MWLKFNAKEPFALKIYTGGVNAISGVPINESAEDMLKRLKLADNKVKQDYVVLPEQPWLDGIATDDGRIRQFVAMPKGSGYSVEAQVTGEEKMGGLQFEVTPIKRGCPEKLRISIVGEIVPKNHELNLRENGLSDSSTILDLKKLIEKEYSIPVNSQQLQVTNKLHSLSLNDTARFSEMWVPNVSASSKSLLKMQI